jgi:hypothetical protein
MSEWGIQDWLVRVFAVVVLLLGGVGIPFILWAGTVGSRGNIFRGSKGNLFRDD